jgi:hypothetical protein
VTDPFVAAHILPNSDWGTEEERERERERTNEENLYLLFITHREKIREDVHLCGSDVLAPSSLSLGRSRSFVCLLARIV